MSDSTVHNLLGLGAVKGYRIVPGYKWPGYADPNNWTQRAACVPGKAYTLSIVTDVAGEVCFGFYLADGSCVRPNGYERFAAGKSVVRTLTAPEGAEYVAASWAVGNRRPMVVEGTEPAAWAPAEGESLAGGGALMSANLLAEGDRRNGADGTTYADGVWSIPANGTSSDKNAANDWPTGTEAVTENQTLHVGLSVRAASGASVVVAPGVAYVDGAGNVNYVATRISARGTGAWQRVEGSFVMPSGMRVSFLFVHQGAGGAALELTAPCLSYGSPVPLASSAHTPYATQDHLRSEYATKAALKVTSDAVTAEVTERGKLAGRVGTLESTTGTHTSKLEQLAASIKSLVKGESTYTDPDGRSATSGIYSLVTQTRDSVTALFGQYTKTADLASTQAVKDAKKAGTDAASAASAAQSTANTAKSTADSLATMIRADSTGITVGKSADGKTWSTGRTRMTDSAFQVLDKAGAVIAQMAKDGASFLAGLVKIVVGTGTLPGNKTANFIRVDAGSGVVGLSGIISRLDATIEGITSSLSAGWEQDFGYGVTAIVRESNTVASAAYLAPDKCELTVGSNQVTMTPDGYALSKPSALRAAVGSYGPVSLSSPYGSLTFCVRAGVATLWVSWGTTADPWGKAQCGEWVIPEAYRPRMDLNAPVALANRGTGDTGDTRLIVEASTGKVLWQNLGGGHSATTFDALLSWGIE